MATISEEEIEWRNRIIIGMPIDAVITDELCEHAGWVKAEIVDIIGTSSTNDQKNLGGLDGKNVRQFSVQYINQSVMYSKHFRADSTKIAHYDSMTSGEVWKYSIKVNDEVDFLKQTGEWETGVVTKIDEIEGVGGCPYLEVALRVFVRGNSTLAKKSHKVPIFSIRI